MIKKLQDLKDGALFQELILGRKRVYRRHFLHDTSDRNYAAIQDVLTGKISQLLKSTSVQEVKIEIRVEEIFTFRDLRNGDPFEVEDQGIFIKSDLSHLGYNAISLNGRMSDGSYYLKSFGDNQEVTKPLLKNYSTGER